MPLHLVAIVRFSNSSRQILWRVATRWRGKILRDTYESAKNSRYRRCRHWLTPYSFADKYDDLATKRYRWVSIDEIGDSASPENHFFLELVTAEVPLIIVDHAAQLGARSLFRRTKSLESVGVASSARRNA